MVGGWVIQARPSTVNQIKLISLSFVFLLIAKGRGVVFGNIKVPDERVGALARSVEEMDRPTALRGDRHTDRPRGPACAQDEHALVRLRALVLVVVVPVDPA